MKDGKTFEDLEKDLYTLTVKACNNEETDCPVSRSLSVYKTTSEEVEPMWQDADQEVTYEFKGKFFVFDKEKILVYCSFKKKFKIKY